MKCWPPNSISITKIISIEPDNSTLLAYSLIMTNYKFRGMAKKQQIYCWLTLSDTYNLDIFL